MGFWLQQKSLTLNDIERQFTALSSVLCVLIVTKQLRLKSRGFRYKVPLYMYLRYLNIKFDDEIEGNPFKFQV